jgi:hypothetical protein
MKKVILLLIVSIINFKAFSQTETLKRKYYSIGSKTIGICFGNSIKYTGLRFNIFDQNVDCVNILNFCLLESKVKLSNGVSTALFLISDDQNNGISLASLGNVGDKRNGIAISGLFTNISKLNGIGLAGLGLMGDTLNGFFASGYGVTQWDYNRQIHLLNGVAMAFIFTSIEKIRGLTIGAINGSLEHKGAAIGIFNYTDSLRGIQIGLINYSGNNPKGLKWLPIINMHWGKINKI